MKRKNILFLAGILCLIASACSNPAMPTEITPQATETPLPPMPTETATPLPPMVTANQQVNCYSGPGEDGYILITTLEKGQQVDVFGKDASGNYWIVIDPKSNKGCWVESQYTSAQGETNALPNLIPQPTVVTRPPNPPENLNITFMCKKFIKKKRSMPTYQNVFTLTWDDKSNSETGFEIYQDKVLINTANSNATTFDYTLSLSGINHVMFTTFSILAFNDAGKSVLVENTVMYQYYCR